MKNDKITLIALCGKAGSGKDTILKEVVKADPHIHEIIRCTTRPRREEEVEGKDYFYLTEEEFRDKIDKKEILEYSIFNNWMYGTPISSLDPNKINIVVLNTKEISLLKPRKDINLIICLVEASDKERLMRQLTREENPNVKEIIRRFQADEEDYSNFDYRFNQSYVLKNHNKDDLITIVKALSEHKK